MALAPEDSAVGLLFDSVNTLCDRVVAPRARAVDEDDRFPKDIYNAMAEMDLFATWIPEEYGGIPLSARARMTIVERLARAHAASALIYANCGDAVSPIIEGASPNLKQQWLPQVATGEAVPAFALTEPGAGSDVTALATQAERTQGGYVINGQKIFITNGSVADVFVVFARTGDGRSDVSAFLVPADTAGVKIGADEKMLGLRGCPTTALAFDDVRVSDEQLLGVAGSGLRLAFGSIDSARLNVSAMALGAARAALEIAVNYAKDRVQFGRPIIEHDGLNFQLAEIAADIYGAWATLERACDAVDGPENPAVGVQAAMTKLKCTSVGMTAATRALQALGGYGLSVEYSVERIFRDVKAFEIFDGTNEIQKLIIGKYFQRVGIPPLTV